MNDPVQYHPAVLCRLIGHRWILSLRKNGHFEPGSQGNWIYDIEYESLTHCTRCGVPNPACKQP